MDLKKELYAVINELRNKSETEIRAILKARDGLKNSLEYMLHLTKEQCEQEKQKLHFVKAHNPQLGDDFIKNNLLQTGYPSLILILESIMGDDPVKTEKAYWEKVSEQFEAKKSRFLSTLNNSGDKIRLIAGEIKMLEELLFGESKFAWAAENEQVQVGTTYFKVSELKHFRKLYQQLIVRGDREYNLTQITGSIVSSGPKDFYHVRVEAFSKYLLWLREMKSINDAAKPLDKKFYVTEDFKELVNNLLSIDEFRVNDFLEYHLTKSVESAFNFLEALRKFLLIDCSFDEPEISGRYGFAVSDDSSTPQQINVAYLWLRNRMSDEVRRINSDANPELSKAELTERDYEIICEKLARIEKEKQTNSVLKSERSEFKEAYESLLSERKLIYEQKNSKMSDTKVLRFENYFKKENPKLVAFLQSRYRTAKPKEIAIMLHALESEELLNERISINQARWITSLSNFFGRTDITRQALYKQINGLNASNDKQSQLIKTHREAIVKSAKK